MYQWWQGLAPREQRMVLLGTVVVGALLLWQLVWHPWQARGDQLQQTVAEQRELVAWVEAAAAALQAAQGPSERGASGRQGVSLLVLADSSARAAGLGHALRRVQPEGAQVRLWFEQAAFDDVMRWLDGLIGEYGVVASSLNAERSEAKGRVNLQVTLSESRR